MLTRLSKQTQQEKRRRLSAAERREVIELAATEVFAEHGYARASIDAIAKRSGVSPPVVYDHFESKKALHRRLLERHYADMRGVWAQHLAGDEPLGVRMPRAFDAWFAYIETHPYAATTPTQSDARGARESPRSASHSTRTAPIVSAVPPTSTAADTSPSPCRR